MMVMDNNNDEIRLKVQALADNELPEQEIGPVLEMIQGSYEYRAEYADLLRLKKRLAGCVVPEPGQDWVAHAERSVMRKLFRGAGTVFFVGSYLGLLAFGLASLFRDPGVPLFASLLVGAGILGLLVLLGSAIADRVRENKTDKYRGVMR